MNIKELADQLEASINHHMEHFNHLADQVRAINEQLVECHKQMYTIVKELEPVEHLVRIQHPYVSALFDTLKSEYQHTSKENNGA